MQRDPNADCASTQSSHKGRYREMLPDHYWDHMDTCVICSEAWLEHDRDDLEKCPRCARDVCAWCDCDCPDPSCDLCGDSWLPAWGERVVCGGCSQATCPECQDGPCCPKD